MVRRGAWEEVEWEEVEWTRRPKLSIREVASNLFSIIAGMIPLRQRRSCVRTRAVPSKLSARISGRRSKSLLMRFGYSVWVWGVTATLAQCWRFYSLHTPSLGPQLMFMHSHTCKGLKEAVIGQVRIMFPSPCHSHSCVLKGIE